jgi:hypothetical protein
VSWIAILLTLLSLNGHPTAAARKYCSHARTTAQKHACKKVVKAKPRTKAKARPRAPIATPAPAPGAPPPVPVAATPAPIPTAIPTVAPTASPTPNPYPSRTGVDLDEWTIHSSYRTLAAGRVVFNASNNGDDDHNLSVRGGGHEYGGVDVAPREQDVALVLQLAPGDYTLYCDLLGHEDQGMRTEITIR